MAACAPLARIEHSVAGHDHRRGKRERRETVRNSAMHIAGVGIVAAGIGLLVPAAALAQKQPVATSILCESKAGERNVCPADTSGGVALKKSTGAAACLLGKTWGYDDAGVWVADGCSGEFQLGWSAKAGEPAQAPTASKPATPYTPVETWGEFDPGKGFLIGRSSAGEMSISGYALVRYVNQTPGEQAFTDHLGNERTVDGRNDIWPHRVMIFLKGWVGTPEADLRRHLLDRARHESERHLWQPRLPVQPEVQRLRRPQRESGVALAPGFASLLAGPRSRHGRRVLPALLQLRRVGSGRTRAGASGTT